jgi:hypothetical protein
MHAKPRHERNDQDDRDEQTAPVPLTIGAHREANPISPTTGGRRS